MGKKASPVVIGAFVVGAVALSVLAITIWGSGKLFQRPFVAICYFPGSVNGLAPGAPVKFRGVQIGEVSEIRLLYEQARGAQRIPVFVKIDGARMRELGAAVAPSPERLKELIDRGLRARLQTQSIVTGVLYVEFDLRPGSPLEFMQEANATYPEIPTVPTALEEATKTVSDVIAQVKELDMRRIGISLREALDGVNRLASNPRLVAAVEGLPDAVAAARRLLVDLDTRTAPLGDGIRDVSQETRQTMESMRVTLESIQALLAPDAPLAVEVGHAAVDLGRAARGIRDLADFLERNPNAVVFGRPQP